MFSFSREKIMVEGKFSEAKITLRFAELGLYEVVTYCTASHLYPSFGDKSIAIGYHYIKVKDGVVYDCNDHFDFDGNIEDTIFTPLVCLPRKETADAVSAFFGVDTSGIAIGVDDKQLFKLKFEKGCVWDLDWEDFVPISQASKESIALSQARHEAGWENVGLYNPSEALN